jgi:polar amino acid transport system substrate-binding protein
MLGYRFESFGIDSQNVDMGTISYEQLIGKLHRGRCDIFVQTREALAGLYLLNPKLLDMLTDPTFQGVPLPGSPTRKLHIAVSPQVPQGQDLLRKLNQGLLEMEGHKQIDTLLMNYLK